MATNLPKIEASVFGSEAPVTDMPRTPDNSFPQAPWMVPRAGNDGPTPVVASTCTACSQGAQMYSGEEEGYEDGYEEGYEDGGEEQEQEEEEESFEELVQEGYCPVTGQYPCQCSKSSRNRRMLWCTVGLLIAAILYFYFTRSRSRSRQ